MRFQRPPATPLLGCAAILVDFIGLGMIAPILPGIVSSDAVGAILTAQYCAVVLGQVLIGALSDCFGRRRLIVAVMAADAVLFAASGFTNDVTTLIVLRLLAGLSAPVALGISYVAAVSQHVSPAKAAFNFVLVGTSFNLGSLVGAATGGLLGPELWLPANLVSGVIPAVVAVWALVSRDAEAPTPAKPEVPTTSTSAVKIDVAGPPRSGLRAVLTAPVYAGNLLAYVAAGIFQGSFFSLMPVAITAATANYSAPEGGESDADADAAPVIAAVIVAASVFQVLSNFLLVRRSLRCFGAHGHLALFGALGAALCAALAIVAHEAPRESTTLYLGILCALYVVAYVLSATTLTVLNQAAAKYAIRFGAPVGTVTGISRSIFSIAFGVAPAASIAAFGAAAWVPYAAMAALSAVAAAAFAFMVVRRWEDPMPRTATRAS